MSLFTLNGTPGIPRNKNMFQLMVLECVIRAPGTNIIKKGQLWPLGDNFSNGFLLLNGVKGKR